MGNKSEALLDSWLEIEFYHIANRAKLIEKHIEVEEELIYITIGHLDYLTTIEHNVDKNYIITIIALMWEYVDRTKYDIKSFILKILSRIGYPTAAIIIDENFDKDNNKFFRMSSIIDQIMATINQVKNEICIEGKVFLLTDFQKDIWDSLDKSRILGISAPTSAGKSFVLLLKTIDILMKDNVDIVYIVPTLSLVNQVTEDYNKMMKRLGANHYKIINSYLHDDDEVINKIYVLTQEKAIAAFSNENNIFTKDVLLIVDEIQNIEKITEHTDTRSKILYDTLTEFRYEKTVKKIVISGPRIEEINKLGKEIFGEDTIELKTLVSPVLNLTYSIKKGKNDFFLKQYCTLRKEAFVQKIKNCSNIQGYGGKIYSDEYLKYLSDFVDNIGNNEQNIIFSPTTDTAKKIACFIAKHKKKVEVSKDIHDLKEYYADTIHEDYAMCSSLEKNVAYHHGKLPMHVRRTIEKAIGDRMISDIVCTTTLTQGVNMPAQNVIIRNPHLYIRKKEDSPELSSYEMANLRGRAGRLLKDFIGRTYVLDESEFESMEDYNQVELFDEATKEITAGYGEKFKEYEQQICSIVKSTEPVDATISKYGYLISYIRQSVIRYGAKAKKRLIEVGIEISEDDFKIIRKQLKSLKIPKEICYQNRYWDPFVLNNIYLNFKNKLPQNPNEKGIKTNIAKLIEYMRDNPKTNYMYTKYIPKEYQRGKKRSIMCELLVAWSQEQPLKTIFSKAYYSGDAATTRIDDTIKLLQETISFNIPLLLQPLYDIFTKESIFLSCVQSGAFRPYTRRMIEIGIPRETAIYLNEELFKKYDSSNKDEATIDNEIRDRIKERHTKLPYWIKVQLEFLV